MSYPPLAVKFLSFSIDSSVVIYTISITDFSSKETFLIQSRYSLLLDMHRHLLNYKFPLPLFPPKKCCFNKETSFLSQRQKALENYFNTLLKNANPLIIKDLRIFFLSLRSACSLPSLPSIYPNKTPAHKIICDLPIKSLFFKGIVDSAIQKFVDINSNSNLCAPDEDEIKKKKELIAKNSDKFLVKSSKMLGELKLPKIKDEKCKKCMNSRKAASKDVFGKEESNQNLIEKRGESTNEAMSKIEERQEKNENNQINENITKFDLNLIKERQENQFEKKEETTQKNQCNDCEKKNKLKFGLDNETFQKYEVVIVLKEMDEIVKNIRKIMNFIVEEREILERAHY